MARKSKSLTKAVIKLVAELGDNQQRFHISDSKRLRYKEPTDKIKQRWSVVQKPWGLWYGFGGSWMDWSANNYSCMLRPYVYEVIFKDESRILKVQNIKQFDAFEDEYITIDPIMRQIHGDSYMSPYGSLKRLGGGIDWPLVMQRYAACEINPYLWEKRLESVWFYGWDCASGCVWDGSVVEFKLVAAFNESKKSYVAS